ncbi:hypothetical protein R1flu_026369 [Riccia fluitans]|uniref:Uncharacterized protein n=1 Tax=Riccia fluitans TaxID=41844 RepID=A0ABD1XIR4_9MARC
MRSYLRLSKCTQRDDVQFPGSGCRSSPSSLPDLEGRLTLASQPARGQIRIAGDQGAHVHAWLQYSSSAFATDLRYSVGVALEQGMNYN